MKIIPKKAKDTNPVTNYLITLMVALVVLFLANRYVTKDATLFQNEAEMEVVRAQVMGVTDRLVEDYSYDDVISQSIEVQFDAKVVSGPRKGEILPAVQHIDYTPPYIYTNEVTPGSKILLIDAGFDVSEWHFVEYIRTDKLLILGAVFVLLLLVMGGMKGFNTLLSLALTFGAVFAVLVPAILSGRNIYLWAILTCFYSILTTLIILNGWDRKSWVTILGCFGGVLVAGSISWIMDRSLALTGVTSDESIYLAYLPTEVPINLRAIIFAAIIIGAMGAIMDVAMSISSALTEMRRQTPVITQKTLFRSGITIGKDIMGTMANTLVLAYVGSALAMVLLLAVSDTSLMFLLNREMIVVEILQALVGSFGIFFAIPITSFFASVMLPKSDL
ncbi:YibE/F family protein [Alkalibacter rhizosphaerae]|uniref:YibE/F family protein n=1 Tax=Alkalibacter rhizosphaerae TaxID=2815577 RepID=A0A974XLC6_9FIRM|nr:YibE/F family protein [Alkalibacter rhizosphaerae]QSX08086.1 YibE/F family protein [Alkalibacter rhizosphaerae]